MGLLTKINGGPTNTFSIGFEEGHFNELAFARIAAQQFKSRHHELTVRPADALEAISKIAAIYDEPFGNSSAMPAYCCARFAREQGMSVLSGVTAATNCLAATKGTAPAKCMPATLSCPQLFATWL